MNSRDRLCNFEGAQIPRQQPHGEEKKQVRRRRQSRRLYKERPVNMAEARKEIVTALKLHRASAKEARERQQIIKQALPLLPQLCPSFEPEGRMKSRRNPRKYRGCSYNCSFYLENRSDFSHVASPKAISLSSSPIVPLPPPVAQNLNIEIPIQQTLGLNLNFHDSKTVDTTSVVCNNGHSFYSLSFLPPSSNMYPTVSYAATHQEVSKYITLSEEGKLIASDVLCSNGPTGESEKVMQGGVDEEAMGEIRSIREQHLKAMEINVGHIDMKALEIDGHHTFDKAMKFPDWLSINDDFLQQHSNYHCAEDYLQDPDLSCMDIGEIEDVDGGWLA